MSHSVNWDFILNQLQEQRCIICIGSELYKQGSKSVEERLADTLKLNTDAELRIYEDGLFNFKTPAHKTLSLTAIQHFFNASMPETESILDQLARIPFHVALTLLPDNKLVQAFEKQKFDFINSFYFKHNAAPSLPNPSKQRPVVYNLLGNVVTQDSLVLTHNDLFDYLDSFFQNKSMPENLKTEIQSARNFILLGIPFDRWYMNLFLRFLSLHNNSSLVKYANGLGVSDDITTICTEQFQINFVEQGIEDFLNTLEAKCKEKNMLRQPRADLGKSRIQYMHELIAEDKLEQCLEVLKEYVDSYGSQGEEWQEDVMVLSGSLRRLGKKRSGGVLSNDEFNIERNRIRDEIMTIIKEVKHLEA